MERALARPVYFDQLFGGCPEPALSALASERVRLELGRRLTSALGRVTIDTGVIPHQAWGPPDGHDLPVVAPQGQDGIPTGLAISGLLLNVALWEADQKIGRYLQGTSGKKRGAIVRFADDMYVLSRSADGLLTLVQAVHAALSGDDAASLAAPNRASNLCINFAKIRPEAAQEVIGRYLLRSGWTECPTCNQPLPPTSTSAESVSDWWAIQSRTSEFARYNEALERTAVSRGEVGPFVTGLVERLSAMGTDTLRQRFGTGARDYLSQLHELARFDIDDEQVRPDTRRAFSVNRLVRAWLPAAQELGEEQRELRRIRETITFVVDRTPWKFSIWRAVVRATARRPLGDADGEEDLAVEAGDWLTNQLRRIACSTDRTDLPAWLHAWPEGDAEDGHAATRGDTWRELYLSFLRTAFWNALAEVIRDLGRHAARLEADEGDPWVPSPALWTARAVREGAHREVAQSLARLDQWTDVLYPELSTVDLTAWPWELDAFVRSVLAAHTTVDLADAWRRHAKGPGSVLLVPAVEHLGALPRVVALLSKSERLLQLEERRHWKLDYWSLASVQLGSWGDGLGEILFRGTTRIRQAGDDPKGVVAAGLALGCFGQVDIDAARDSITTLDGRLLAVGLDALLLHDYIRARRIVVGQEANPVARTTVHRLLWGMPENAELADWQMAPWETPALGLPSRVAAALFCAVHGAEVPSGWEPRDGPLTWQIDDTKRVLATGRRTQFDRPTEFVRAEQALSMARSQEWEVLPNAAFYLPFVSASGTSVHPPSYVLYCDVLLLLTVLEGDERILDGLARWGVSGTPFVDRWAWRSRIHLPLETWTCVEEVLRWSDSPGLDATLSGARLAGSLTGWSQERVSWEDFLPERIDVGLFPRNDVEVVRTIGPADSLLGADLPTKLFLSDESIADELVVRVGQVTAWADKPDVVPRFPAVSSAAANAMIEQVTNAFLAPAQTIGDAAPRLVVLPELSIPQQEIRSLRDLVRDEGKGAVAGLYWRALKPAFQPSVSLSPRRAYFVNEAELIVPVGANRGPPSVRWFRVRKPVPAHIEDGLAEALTARPPGTRWQMLRGDRWYRFVHPEWGDFTVAICADLIDAGPWRALRGELLHLLMVAFNQDVDLFDSLTWVRAYENYVNVASVNHGEYGGSFLWTPRRKYGRELARLRGGELVLTADVQLPVKELLAEQRTGVSRAISDSAALWRGTKTPSSDFKAPPPGFLRKD